MKKIEMIFVFLLHGTIGCTQSIRPYTIVNKSIKENSPIDIFQKSILNIEQKIYDLDRKLAEFEHSKDELKSSISAGVNPVVSGNFILNDKTIFLERMTLPVGNTSDPVVGLCYRSLQSATASCVGPNPPCYWQCARMANGHCQSIGYWSGWFDGEQTSFPDGVPGIQVVCIGAKPR